MSKMIGNKKVSLIAYIILFLTTVCLIITYLSAMLDTNDGADNHFSSPLDDTLIHLVYAKNISKGHFYQYNLEDSPTTGNTSILYPFVLAIGFIIGLQDLELVGFAFFINAIFLLLSAFYLVRFCHKAFNLLIGFIAGMYFVLNSHILWGYFSGMEIGLFSFLIIILLYTYHIQKHTRLYFEKLSIILAILVVTRPEGSLIYLIITIAVFIEHATFERHKLTHYNKKLYYLLLPLAFIILQYILNYALTGKLSSNGMIQKSIFYNPIYSLSQSFSWMITDFEKILHLMLGGFWYKKDYSHTLFPFFLLTTLIGGIYFIVKNNWRLLNVLLAVFLLCVFLTMTLETRLWHFHRYQIPFFVPIVILFSSGLYAIIVGIVKGYLWLSWVVNAQNKKKRFTRLVNYPLTKRIFNTCNTKPFRLNFTNLFKKPYIAITIPIAILITLLATGYAYLAYSDVQTNVRFYAIGCKDTYLQQINMGEYIKENLPNDAVVLVNDAGAIKYISDCYALDIVGLCHNDFPTINRLKYPAVLERVKNISYPKEPDYVAVFPKWYPFDKFFCTSKKLHTSPISGHMMAGNGLTKTLFNLDLSIIKKSQFINDPTINAKVKNLKLLDRLDVADLIIEQDHEYFNNSKPHLVIKQFRVNTAKQNSDTEKLVLCDFEDESNKFFNIEGLYYKRIKPNISTNKYSSNIGYNGNYFFSSHSIMCDDHDKVSITSKPFTISKPNLFFLISSKEDLDNLYVRGLINDIEVFKVTGDKQPTFLPINIDLSSHLNEKMVIEIVNSMMDSDNDVLVDYFMLTGDEINDYKPNGSCYEAGKLVNQYEEFFVTSMPNTELLLIGRLLFDNLEAKVAIYVNDIFYKNYQLSNKTFYSEHLFKIGASKIISDKTKIKIEFLTCNNYESYHYWCYSMADSNTTLKN